MSSALMEPARHGAPDGLDTTARYPADRYAKPTSLNGFEKHWAECYGNAPFLPMSRAEMDALGWDSCDVILVVGDAYVDHPSFGMALVGRLLEAQGFRVGMIAQPTWDSAEPFKALGKPNLFFGVSAGNMDSMINRYTADRKVRNDDAYTPGAAPSMRPDRASLVYAQRCKEAYVDVPIVLGGIEASLRRIAHYDYWQDSVRRSVLVDAKADILLFGNAERALVEVAHRLARGQDVRSITDVRGTAFLRRSNPSERGDTWFEIDSTSVDALGPVESHVNPYMMSSELAQAQGGECVKEEANIGIAAGMNTNGYDQIKPLKFVPNPKLAKKVKAPVLEQGEGEEQDEIELAETPQTRAAKRVVPARDRSVIRLPSYEDVRRDPVLYAHANRVLHLETNPGNARALVQRHGEGASSKDVWMNPPAIPLSTEEMDYVYGLPYARTPHPRYADAAGKFDGDTKIPAYEMIRFSVNIMRGCFGGCTFCSITEHEGRIIQSRSEESILREIEDMRDKVPGFTGVVSDLGGPTANMYRIACKSKEIERHCRKPSCVWPDVCPNLNTDHSSLISLYRKARGLRGVKKILISSGLRYDLAVKSPEYVKELVTHHVGGYLKIAPEHTESGPLSKMMKPGMGAYDRFKKMFEEASAAAGKKQYLIPYFIAAHPGTRDEDMMNLALWLKKNGYRADQVQTFYPSPMATATAMYHSGRNPLKKVSREAASDEHTVDVVRGEKRRRLHKAFLRYHDANNWPLLREALKTMGRADLIGNGKHHLIPTYQPLTDGSYESARRKNSTRDDGRSAKTSAGGSAVSVKGVAAKPGRILTQHTGLPPRRQK